jgi:hypothetical protein
MGLLFEEFVLLAFQLAAGAFLLAGSFLLCSDEFAFGLDLGQVVGGQFDLAKP